MKNPVQLTINVILLLAVAGLYFLHFNHKPTAPAIATDKSTAVMASPDTNTATDSVAAPAAVDASAPAAETTTTTAPAPAGSGGFEGKIAYVESGKMLDGYQGMKDARKAFEGKARNWEKQNQAMLSNFKAAVEAYQKQAAGLTAEQRAATEQKLQAQQQEVGQKQQQLQAQAQQEEGKLTQKVLESVNKKVEAYGKAHGYKLILIAAPSGTIAYGQKDLDITAPVLAYLNAEYRK